MSKYSGYSASVTHRNTPESDMQATVQHTVTFLEDNVKKEIQVHATDPFDAINIIRSMHRREG